MSYDNQSDRATGHDSDPYTDPVTYLASFGIEAELVEVIVRLPEAA